MLDNIVGQRFGRCTVICRVPDRTRWVARWKCACDCGKNLEADGNHLKSGKILSCKCYRIDLATRHGGVGSAEYSIWQAMIQRCTNPRNKAWENYGGRGITVCEKWRISFENFLSDMGLRPSGLEIDRIDNDGNYEPGNCRWATREQNHSNMRKNKFVEFHGERLTISQLSRKTGVRRNVLRLRLLRGWPIERAIMPSNFRNVRDAQRSPT